MPRSTFKIAIEEVLLTIHLSTIKKNKETDYNLIIRKLELNDDEDIKESNVWKDKITELINTIYDEIVNAVHQETLASIEKKKIADNIPNGTLLKSELNKAIICAFVHIKIHSTKNGFDGDTFEKFRTNRSKSHC